MLGFLNLVNADVWIPEEGLIDYFDAQGTYTVVGTIKNSENYPVIPIVTINIEEGSKIISKYFDYGIILPQKDLPFKIKIPEITSKEPVLKKPRVDFLKTEKKPLDVEVIYDRTLKKHADGQLTGRIINNGQSTVYNLKVFATIHGEDGIIDMTQNVERIDKLEPGQIKTFTMYPDPSVDSKVNYYSCFAIGDETIVPVRTTRNGEKFYFRYDSVSWFAYATFSEDGRTLTMRAQNNLPLTNYVNFEFPRHSDNEKFVVYFNDKTVDFIQSIDEVGNWHVAFNIEPYSSGKVVITGFEKGKPLGTEISVLNWIISTASYWSTDQVSTEDFVSGIRFMIREGIINVPASMIHDDNFVVPRWLKNNAGWWSDGTISDNDFINGIKYLLEKQIIVV